MLTSMITVMDMNLVKLYRRQPVPDEFAGVEIELRAGVKSELAGVGAIQVVAATFRIAKICGRLFNAS